MIYISANHSGDDHRVSSEAQPERKRWDVKQLSWYEVNEGRVEIGIRYDAVKGHGNIINPTFLREGIFRCPAEMLLEISIEALATEQIHLTRGQFETLPQPLAKQFPALNDETAEIVG